MIVVTLSWCLCVLTCVWMFTLVGCMAMLQGGKGAASSVGSSGKAAQARQPSEDEELTEIAGSCRSCLYPLALSGSI